MAGTFFNNSNMPNTYPSQNQQFGMPMSRRQQVERQQQLHHQQYLRQCQQYQHQEYLRQQNQQQYQGQQYQQPQPQCLPQHAFQQGGYLYPQQQYGLSLNPYQQAELQAQLQAQYLYDQECWRLYNLRQQQLQQQVQYQHIREQQQQQQQQQLNSNGFLAELTFDNTVAQYQDVPSTDIAMPVRQQESEPIHQTLQQHDPLPSTQQNPLVGATRESPIQIDDEVEVLTEESVTTPPSQQGQPKTPPVREAPCVPAPKKPENSFFSEAYGKMGKDGKVKRLGIEEMARQNSVRLASLKKLTFEERRVRMKNEDVARAGKLAKQKKAKELGLANPTEEERGEQGELLVYLNEVLEEEERQKRPASLKRKSLATDDAGNFDSEPATKMIRIGTKRKKNARPVTSTSSRASENQEMVTEEVEASYDELMEGQEETASADPIIDVPVPCSAELDVDETSKDFDDTPVLSSVEHLYVARPVSPEPVSSGGNKKKAKAASKQPAKPRRKQPAKTPVEIPIEAQSAATKGATRRRNNKKAKKTTPPRSPSASPHAADAENNTASQKPFTEEELRDLVADFEAEDDEVNEAEPEVKGWTAEEIAGYEAMMEEDEDVDGTEPVVETTESVATENVELTESVEFDGPQQDKDTDSLFGSDSAEEPIERRRSPSVESDEDEDENFEGNLKYKNRQ